MLRGLLPLRLQRLAGGMPAQHAMEQEAQGKSAASLHGTWMMSCASVSSSKA